VVFERQDDPTEAQNEVYNLILDCVCDNGFQPSMSEMAEALEISVPAVGDRVRQCASKGLFELQHASQARCLRFRKLRFRPEHGAGFARLPAATEGEALVWESLVEGVSRHGYQPSGSEIASYIGRSKPTVHHYVKGLEKKGYIRRGPKGAERAIALLHTKFVPEEI
jgi:SOS-response transcriptional repressor LexA